VIVANRAAIGDWESFSLGDIGDGKVSRWAANSRFVCAEGGGGGTVVANRAAVGAWETFVRINR
jgi:hypothetical protein